MASSDGFNDAVEAFEQTLCQVRTVHVFKIPPRVTSGGYRAGDWKDEVWQGSLKVVQKGQDAAVLLIDPKTNALFAMCPVKEGSVERCVDSSRYFVLKIQNAQGKHAFIGVAFNEREEAFDFNVALQEYEKDKEREEKMRNGTYEQELANQPKLDLSLKEGQKIAIKLPSRAPATNPDGTPTAPAAPAAMTAAPARKRGGATGLGANPNGGLLPPPPGSGGLLAPPPSSARSASPASTLFDPLANNSDASSAATVASTASSSSTLSSFDSFPAGSSSNNGGGNSQPAAGTGFAGFDAFDPLVPTAEGGRAAASQANNSSGGSGGSKGFSALDDWMGVASALPQQQQPAQAQQAQPNAWKPAPSSDPFAGLDGL